MNGINLLPWREEKRRVRDRRMLFYCGAIWIICGALILSGHRYLQRLQDNQKQRNDYLTAEITRLNAEIEEIDILRSKKDALIARMEVIQNLQSQRTQVVHVFDDIVRKLPDGVYFTSMDKKGRNFGFTGTAQSNARVSNLMDRMDSSDWFANPELKVINVMPSEGVRLSEFDLQLTEQNTRIAEESL